MSAADLPPVCSHLEDEYLLNCFLDLIMLLFPAALVSAGAADWLSERTMEAKMDGRDCMVERCFALVTGIVMLITRSSK